MAVHTAAKVDVTVRHDSLESCEMVKHPEEASVFSMILYNEGHFFLSGAPDRLTEPLLYTVLISFCCTSNLPKVNSSCGWQFDLGSSRWFLFSSGHVVSGSGIKLTEAGSNGFSRLHGVSPPPAGWPGLFHRAHRQVSQEPPLLPHSSD